MLLWLQPFVAGCFLAEMQEAADAVTELAQRSIIVSLQLIYRITILFEILRVADPPVFEGNQRHLGARSSVTPMNRGQGVQLAVI